MKKIFLIMISAVFAVFVSQGQTRQKTNEKEQIKETKKELKAEKQALRQLEGTVVSNVAKDNFRADFGNPPDLVWRRSGVFDEASFTKDGKEWKAFYDNTGKFVGSTKVMTFSDLPAVAQKDIKAKYKDYTVKRVIYFDDNEANETDMLLYGKQFEDADNYFVELSKGTKNIALQVNLSGDIFFFSEF